MQCKMQYRMHQPESTLQSLFAEDIDVHGELQSVHGHAAELSCCAGGCAVEAGVPAGAGDGAAAHPGAMGPRAAQLFRRAGHI